MQRERGKKLLRLMLGNLPKSRQRKQKSEGKPHGKTSARVEVLLVPVTGISKPGAIILASTRVFGRREIPLVAAVL